MSHIMNTYARQNVAFVRGDVDNADQPVEVGPRLACRAAAAPSASAVPPDATVHTTLTSETTKADRTSRI